VVSIAEPFNYRIFERKRRLEEDIRVQLQACHVLSVEQKPKTKADSVLGRENLNNFRASAVALSVLAFVGAIMSESSVFPFFPFCF
jgi:hypothetical protein